MADLHRTTDIQIVADATIDDLDMTLVQRHITAAQERGRYRGPTELVAFLERYRCVARDNGTLQPTLAGVLAFTNEPERWLTTSGIDVAQFSGRRPRSTEMKFIEQVRGPLFAVIDRAAEILWDRTEHGYRIEGLQRVPEHAYPEVVLRELTVNALCHRNWSIAGSRVRIHLFDDSIEWISPGSLPEGVNIDNLPDAQVSRNPALVELLFQATYIEGLGLGMDTVFDTLRDHRHEAPSIRDSSIAFTFKVFGRELRTEEPPHQALVADRRATIMALITQRGALTITDLEAVMGIQRRTIQRDLQTLVTEGLLEVAGSTNNRRYRKPST